MRMYIYLCVYGHEVVCDLSRLINLTCSTNLKKAFVKKKQHYLLAC